MPTPSTAPRMPENTPEGEFTMFPGAHIPTERPRFTFPVGVLVSWTVGAILVIASTILLLQFDSTECDTPSCAMSTAVAISGAGAGIFFGALFLVLGMWSVKKAAAQAAHEANQLRTIQNTFRDL